MEFSKIDYALVGIWLPLMIIFAVLSGAFLLNRYLAVRKYHFCAIMFLWGTVLVFLLYGLAICSQGLKYPISAALQQHATQYITVGKVENIQNAPYPPIYFDTESKQFAPAKILTVDGVRFYLPFGDVQVGQTIELCWATEEHVVYTCCVLPSEKQHENGSYPVNPPVQLHPYAELGSTVATMSAILFVLVVILQYPFGKVMAPHFIQKDQKFQDSIVPNRFGLLYASVPFLLLCGILGGLAFSGFHAIILVLLIGTFCIGRTTIKKQTTTVILVENQLVFRTFAETTCIGTDSVKTVKFVASRLPHNRCLVLTLKNGMNLRFEQEHFYGLECMYRKLSGPQEEKSNIG